MPTYEYECDACGHRFERFQKMTDQPVKRCPTCRGRVRRVLGTGAGIIFRGSGFYQTDYRSESYKSAAKKEIDTGTAKADKGAKSEAGKTGAGKSETKKASSDD